MRWPLAAAAFFGALLASSPAFAPPALIVAVGAAAGVAISATTAAIISAVVSLAASLALSFISKALFKQKKPRFNTDFALENQDRTQQVRQPLSPFRLIYGEVRTSGPITVLEGRNNGTVRVDVAADSMIALLTLTAYPSAYIRRLYIEDTVLPLNYTGAANTGYTAAVADKDPGRQWTASSDVNPPDMLDETWAGLGLDGSDPTEGFEYQLMEAAQASTSWNNYIYVQRGLGYALTDADLNAFMRNKVGLGYWGGNDRLLGCTKIAIDYKFANSLYRGGLPKITAMVGGRRVYDPRETGKSVTAVEAAGAYDHEPDVREWSTGGSLTVDGFKFTDANASGHAYATQAITNEAANTDPWVILVEIEAKDDAADDAMALIRWNQGGGNYNDLVFDPRDGSYQLNTGGTPETAGTPSITDCGTFYRIIWEIANTGADEAMSCDFYPAVANGTVATGYSAAATGYQKVQRIEVFRSNWITVGSSHGFVAGDEVFVADVPGITDGRYIVFETNSTQIRLVDEHDVPVRPSSSSAAGTVTKLYYSNNPALCWADFRMNEEIGPGDSWARINEAALTAAANICDEEVLLQNEAGKEVTFINAGDWVQITSGETIRYLRTGDGVRFTTTGTLPTGLSTGTTYYVVEDYPGTYRLASTYLLALRRTPDVTFTTGSGTHTMTRYSEPRYTCDGVFEADEEPREIENRILSCMSGDKVRSGSSLFVKAGGYTTPTLTITDSLIRGPARLNTRRPRTERFNAVRGTFFDRENTDQPNDFPAVTNATYLAEDNNRQRYADMSLGETRSPSMAQRLAKIELEKNRQEINADLVLGIEGLKLRAGDFVYWTNDYLGFSAKPFYILRWRLVPQVEDTTVRLNIGVTLQEVASTLWDWNNGDETKVDLAPNSFLPNPRVAPTAPSGITAASGTGELITKNDGTILSRIHLTWTASSDPYAIEQVIEWKKTADSTYIQEPVLRGDAAEYWLWDVEDGVAYDVRIKARNSRGMESAYATASHTVVGKTAPPSDVSNFTATKIKRAIRLSWDHITDADRKEYEIRLGSTWASATVVGRTAGNVFDYETTTTGDYDFLIKAVDTTGNLSTNATAESITVAAPAAPTGLSLDSGGDKLFISDAGTVLASIEASWTLPSGDLEEVEIQWRKSSGGVWNVDKQILPAENTLTRIRPVDSGVNYDVRVRARDTHGFPGSWATVSGHTVIGKTAAPEDVTGFTATQLRRLVKLTWTAVSDKDLGVYEIRTGASWAAGSVLAQVKTTYFDVEIEAAGSTTYWIKAVDTSGNYSTNAASDSVSISAPAEPTGLSLDSGGDKLFVQYDTGDVVAAVEASWSAPSGDLVSYEVQWRKTSGGSWDTDNAVLDATKTKYLIRPVDSGVSYDVRVRAIDVNGLAGSWASVTGHTIVGKTAPPSDVASIGAQDTGQGVTIQIARVSDKDLRGYLYRYTDSSLTFVWEGATELNDVALGTQEAILNMPPGSWTIGVKAVDTSGNESTNAATTDVVVEQLNPIIEQLEHFPRWTGTVSNLLFHGPTGYLVPDESDSDASGLWDTFDGPSPNTNDGYYQAPEVDLTLDADDVRIHANITRLALPEQSAGQQGLAEHWIDYREDADAYDGFELWTVGVVTARYIKGQAHVKEGALGGFAVLTGYQLTTDSEVRLQSRRGVTVAIGGTTIVFPRAYVNPPSFSAQAYRPGGAERYAVWDGDVDVTNTQATVRVHDGSNNDVGGKVDWWAQTQEAS